MKPEIPGYDYGNRAVSKTTVTLDELRQLEQVAGWTDKDAEWLRIAADTLVPQAERLVDGWRAEIGRQPHLSAPFLQPDGEPDEAYKAAIKRRFVQWVSDLCLRPHDQDWLAYQQQIGERHTPLRKNQADGAHAPAVVPLRYTISFAAVVITSIRHCLASAGKTMRTLQTLRRPGPGQSFSALRYGPARTPSKDFGSLHHSDAPH